MQKRMKIGLAAVTFAALGFAALGGQGLAPAAAQTDGFSEGQVKGIEKIVKDYLINHPEVLLEAQDALEKKQEAMRTEAVKAKLPAFYKTLADLAPQLSSMSIGSGDVTVVEFFDYNCGYCRKTLPDLVKLTRKRSQRKSPVDRVSNSGARIRSKRPRLASPPRNRANIGNSIKRCSRPAGHPRTRRSRLRSSSAST